jgi:mannose-6-phosphate isomerase
VRLRPNQLHHFYRGGQAIADFRGITVGDEFAPEDWIGSTVTRYGEERTGLTRLDDGRLLRTAILEDPEAFLGPAHVRRYGPDPAVLVKLLDPGQRLPIHFHPDREFAARRLHLRYGKNEAWFVMGVSSPEPRVYLGFKKEVRPATVGEWVRRQDTGALLEAVNPAAVQPGDAIFVPAGIPHAIGAGVMVVELQEPTDLSVLLEWKDLAIDGARDGHLGLGFDIALQALDRDAWSTERLRGLGIGSAQSAAGGTGVHRLFVDDADPFFRAERIRTDASVALDPQYAIVVVLTGHGRLETAAGEVTEVSKGDTLLIPFAAGAVRLQGPIDCIRCMPPRA